MKNRSEAKYIIKLYESQWDDKHIESVKPFFEQLQREVKDRGHNALYSYYVFTGAESLKSTLNYKLDADVDGRFKIGYFAVHGEKDRIQALHDIGRVKLRNMLYATSSFDGLYFGACDFTNQKTAELLLNTMPTLKWTAGFSKWCPFLEGTICDILFFKLLMSGRFRRPSKTNTRWDIMTKPEDAAKNLYEVFPMAVELKFSLFYRGPNGINSTLEDWENRIMAS